jgi:hypothetical protein
LQSLEAAHPNSLKAVSLDVSIEMLDRFDDGKAPARRTPTAAAARPAPPVWPDFGGRPVGAGSVSDRQSAAETLLAETQQGHDLRLRLGLVPKSQGRAQYARPQCLFNALSAVPTSYRLSEPFQVCVRHAARWSVAIRMHQLCRREFFAGRELDCSIFEPNGGASLDLPVLDHCPLVLTDWPSRPLDDEVVCEDAITFR